MPRPQKYKTDAERVEAVRAQSRERMRKHRVKRNNKTVTQNPVNVTVNVTQNSNDNNDNNSKLVDLQKKYDELLYELEVTNEYCTELEGKLAEAKEMGY